MRRHPRVCLVLCRTSGGAGGGSPRPGHLPGLDLPLLLGPLPCHPHGDPQGRWLPLGPDQQVGHISPAVLLPHSEQGHRRDVSPALQAGFVLSPPQHLQRALQQHPAALLLRPGAILSTILRVHAEYFTTCTEGRFLKMGSWPPVWLWPWGSAASWPLQLPSHSAEPRKGLKSQGEAAQLLRAPMSLRGQRQPPSLPVLTANEWED